MANVSIDRILVEELSGDPVEIVATAFECGLTCEQVRFEYVKNGIPGNIAIVDGPNPLSDRQWRYVWNTISLSPGEYTIRARGLSSGQVATAASKLTVSSITGGGIDGELLEAYIVPASPEVNTNFNARALVNNKGTATAQFYFNALYIDTANNFVNSKRSTTGTIPAGQNQLLSCPNMLSTVAGKVIIDLRSYPDNVTRDLKEVTILPSGGTTSAKAVIDAATVPAVVNHNTEFAVAVMLSEIHGISGSAQIRPVIDDILQNPGPAFTIAGGATNVRKDVKFKFTGPANRTIGFKVETFINNGWIATDTEISKPVQVLAPIGPPPPPPPNGPPLPPPPPTGEMPQIPLEYIIIGIGVVVVGAAVLLPKGRRR